MHVTSWYVIFIQKKCVNVSRILTRAYQSIKEELGNYFHQTFLDYVLSDYNIQSILVLQKWLTTWCRFCHSLLSGLI